MMNNSSTWGSLLGQSLGQSEWITIDQNRIDRFAEVTEDRQFIHVDPDAAAQTAFGSTIAHGYLTLSLMPSLMYSLIEPYRTSNTTIINYGSNKLRFLNPVKSNARIRLATTLEAVTDKGPAGKLLTFNSVVEIEHEEKPALISETMMMVIAGDI